MPLFSEGLPYTNFHGMNLDWVINKLATIEEEVTNQDREYVEQRLQELYIDSSYDPGTETLVLSLADSGGE